MKTLLKNGFVYDGTGQPAFIGDVLVEEQQIVEIDTNINSKVDKTIDCSGLCIAPGFIDAHSHNDFFVNKDETEQYFAPFIKQGITTQITGNCGLSPFGIAENSPFKAQVGGGIFHGENPGSFAQFLTTAQGRLHMNIAPLVGHGTIRAGINGNTSAPLSKTQMKELLFYVNEALKAGAFGGSLGLMYEPGLYAPFSELVAFSKEVAKYDGILTVHPRACSKISLSYRPIFTRPHIELAFDEVATIAKESGVKLHYSHLICVGKSTWNSCDWLLNKIHTLGITYDFYAFCHGASTITVILPPWYMGLSLEKRKNKFVQLRLKLLINITRKLLGLDFDDFLIADMDKKYKDYLGKNIAELAKMERLSKIDMYLKLVELSNGTARIYISKYNNEEIIRTLMQDDLSMLMTDAWIEDRGIQNQAAFQGLPYFLIKAREANLPLEKIIHKMSGKTAERFGLPSRGILKSGNFADITVFDFKKLSVDLKTPNATPNGITYVFINGNIVVDNGVYTPSTCGQMVLKNNN
ncbi:MAG: amidohydrolase family protein [Lachnospiraceae bacterium]|nr:amidohydrolase family protein [Lachnospiraceae bacterium]